MERGVGSAPQSMKQLTVGVFEVVQLTEFRWRVRNTLTTFEHVTYGPEGEVIELLLAQSKAWKLKLDKTQPKQVGQAWRRRQTVEAAKVTGSV